MEEIKITDVHKLPNDSLIQLFEACVIEICVGQEIENAHKFLQEVKYILKERLDKNE